MVDMEKLMVNSVPGKKLLAPLNELVQSARAEVERIEGDIRQVRDQAVNLTKTSAPGNEQALAGLQRQYDKDLADMERFEAEARQKIEKQRFQSLSEFNHLAMPLIQALGKEKGYTMIFRKQESGLLYSDDSGDLTEELLTRLNTQAGAK